MEPVPAWLWVNQLPAKAAMVVTPLGKCVEGGERANVQEQIAAREERNENM